MILTIISESPIMKEAAIGIDIGGTNTAFGLVDMEGNIYANQSISTQIHNDFNLYLKDLTAIIDETINSLSEKFIVKGIGVGAPNGNYYKGTIDFAPNLKWKGIIPVVAKLKKYYDYPAIVLTNDANAAAIGEMIYGRAKGMKDFIVITLGTGLGSGIVVNGELVYGHDGFAGEIGHIIVEAEGRQCQCGRIGCLETYASATGIKTTTIELLSNTNEESILRMISEKDLTAKLIGDAANNGDNLAKKAFEYTGKMLGFALANSVAHLSPEAIFLFGGLAQAGDLIFSPTKKFMEKNLLNIFRNKVKLLPSGLPGADAAILGASALVWKELK